MFNIPSGKQNMIAIIVWAMDFPSTEVRKRLT